MNLNGHSVGGDYGNMFLVTDDATLIVVGDGVLGPKYGSSVCVVSGSTLLLEGGILKGTLETSGTCIMSGGKVSEMIVWEEGFASISGGEVTTLYGESHNVLITGGTFGMDPSQYIPNGPYKVINNSDGTYTVLFDQFDCEIHTEETIPGYAATCTTPGLTDGVSCSVCGITIIQQEEIPATGHDWKAATCTAPKTCSVCGATSGNALGHNWQTATCTEPKICAACGTTDGNAQGHNWQAATCTNPKICAVCGTTEGNALGHNWQAASCTNPKTCSACGTTEGNALGHNWKAATCTDPKMCTVCGTTEGNALGHNFENHVCRLCGIVSPDIIAIYTGEELEAALQQGGDVVLMTDIRLNDDNGYGYEPLFVMKDTCLDLNGHSVSRDCGRIFLVTDGATLTIFGDGVLDLEDGYGTSVDVVSGSTLVLMGGILEGTLEVSGTCVMNGGKVSEMVVYGEYCSYIYGGEVTALWGQSHNVLVTGGTFGMDPSQYIPNGPYKVIGDGVTYTVEYQDDGHLIPDGAFAVYDGWRLAEALKRGGDIALMADIPAGKYSTEANYGSTDTFFVRKDTCLNLNGHSVSGDYGNIFLVTDYATLTILGDGVLDLKHDVGTSVGVVSGSTLVLEGGILEGTLEVSGNCVMSGGKVTEMVATMSDFVMISGGEVTTLWGDCGNIFISGGTFGFNPSEFTFHGPYKITHNGDGTYTVEYQDDGYLIPDGAYPVYDGWRLAEALKWGSYIVLMEDIPSGDYCEDGTFYVAQDTWLDLNGHSISGDYGDSLQVTNYATLTIFGDGVLEQINVYIDQGSTLTLESGILEGTLEVDGTCVMDGGKVSEMVVTESGVAIISGGEVATLRGESYNVLINGGTFGFDPSAFTFHGTYKIIRNSDGTYTVEYQDEDHLIPEGACAVYDEWKLVETLKWGGYIVLMEDIPQGEYGVFVVSQDTILDLNGHTIAGGDRAITVQNGNLTLFDSSASNPQPTASVYSLRTIARNKQGGILEGRIEVDGGSATIAGGTVNELVVNAGAAVITGGIVNDMTVNAGTVTITGGTLGFDPSTTVDPDRYNVVDNGDGTYSVLCNHFGGKATCQTLALCDYCGESYGMADPDGHISEKVENQATCTEPAVCDLCGCNYGQARGHQIETTIIEPTCTSEGHILEECIFCDDEQRKTIPVLPHNYEDGVCTGCGKVDGPILEPVVLPTLTLKAPTLEFKDMITVNAMFTAENIQDVVEMGMITYSTKVDEWSIDTAEHVIPGTTYDETTQRYIATSQGIHAKYLGDTVYLACYAKLTDGSYVYTKLASYSPVQYAESKLKGNDVPLKQLVVAMLNYGAAAQIYFNHNIENLANVTLTAEQIKLPEVYRSDMVSNVASPDAAKQGVFANNKGFAKRYPAISFEGAFCINYFFKPAYTPVDGITLYYWNAADYEAAEVLTAQNATGSMKLEGEETSEYRGDITGIAAKALSEATYVVAVYSDGTTEWSSGILGYSIGAYCASQSTKGGTIADLAMATAVYGYHAKQYFG